MKPHWSPLEGGSGRLHPKSEAVPILAAADRRNKFPAIRGVKRGPAGQLYAWAGRPSRAGAGDLHVSQRAEEDLAARMQEAKGAENRQRLQGEVAGAH